MLSGFTNATPTWWGGRRHQIFTIVVFVLLISLDNAARTVFPPLYAIIAREFAVTEAALGAVTAGSLLVAALSAVLWGYRGDMRRRKPLIFWATVLWSAAMFWTATSSSYAELLASQLVMAVGIGCIASVGYSVMVDLVPTHRRGLILGLWGLSQGVGGGGGGALLGSTLGAYNWRLPFAVIAAAGMACALLYIFCYDPQRGQTEPELARMFARGENNQRTIRFSDLRVIFSRRTNLWLLLQGLMSTVAYGAFIWMPRLFIARIEVLGYSLETATVVGNMLALLFQTGYYFSVLAGHYGDLWQRKDLRGRAYLCMIGSLGAIPFLMMLFVIPITSISLPPDGNVIQLILATMGSVFTEPRLMLIFVIALIGTGLLAADGPNRSALISEVNLPEHRSTVAGINTLLIGLGLGLGNFLAGVTFTYLEGFIAAPTNYALGLVIFQIFFVPAGLFYFLASRTSPRDILAVRSLLSDQAKRDREGDAHDDS